MTAPGWIDSARRPVAHVTAELGIRPGRGGSLSPCPACGADRRGDEDQRGPLGLTGDGMGWRCHVCKAGGDAIDLVAVAVAGAALRDVDPATVRAWFAARGWCSAAPGDAPPPVVRPRPAPPAPTPRPAVPPGELVDAWAACGPVGRDAEVGAWLAGRGFDVAAIEDRDLCRALPPGFSARWAWGPERTPWSAGWRAILPRWDHVGALVGLRARWVGADEPPAGAKATGKGSGVLACRLGRHLLEVGSAPAWWPADKPLRVIVAEGEPAWLAWALAWADTAPTAPAVFGLVAGAWTAEIAARIPDGAHVTIATDHDDQGRRYADEVDATLRPRCPLYRWTPRSFHAA